MIHYLNLSHSAFRINEDGYRFTQGDEERASKAANFLGRWIIKIILKTVSGCPGNPSAEVCHFTCNNCSSLCKYPFNVCNWATKLDTAYNMNEHCSMNYIVWELAHTWAIKGLPPLPCLNVVLEAVSILIDNLEHHRSCSANQSSRECIDISLDVALQLCSSKFHFCISCTIPDKNIPD